MKNVWQNVLKVASSAVLLALFTAVSYAEIYYWVSSSFFEASRLLYGSAFLSVLFLAVEIAATLYFGIALFRSLYRPETKRCGVLTLALELVVVALAIAMPFIGYFSRLTEGVVYVRTLPYFLVGFVAIFFLYLIPLALKKRAVAIVLIVASLLFVAGIAAIPQFDGELTFDAAPAVFDNGTDFSVVWCTSDDSVGYLEYEYLGEKYVVYDAADGKYRTDSRVHTVHVPYDHLYGNTYTVSSAKVLLNASKESKLGEFVTSEKYTFAAKAEGKLRILSVTDWHEKSDKIVAATSYKEYDLLLMMGDSVNYANEFEDLIDHVVIPAGDMTGGTKPILFARGNHEPRGKYASRLKELLGYDSYYFTARYAGTNFLVFDSGEDSADSEEKHGGLFVAESYRAKELYEMEALPVLEGDTVCLSHIPDFTYEEDDEGYARFRAILAKQGVKLEVSGHEHFLGFYSDAGLSVLIGGGPTDRYGYVSCYIEIEDGVATIEAFDEEGDVVNVYGPVSLS